MAELVYGLGQFRRGHQHGCGFKHSVFSMSSEMAAPIKPCQARATALVDTYIGGYPGYSWMVYDGKTDL